MCKIPKGPSASENLLPTQGHCCSPTTTDPPYTRTGLHSNRNTTQISRADGSAKIRSRPQELSFSVPMKHSHNSCCTRGCTAQGSRAESSREALAREASTSSAALSISAISLPSKASWLKQAQGVLQSTALSEEIQPSPDSAAGSGLA